MLLKVIVFLLLITEPLLPFFDLFLQLLLTLQGISLKVLTLLPQCLLKVSDLLLKNSFYGLYLLILLAGEFLQPALIIFSKLS